MNITEKDILIWLNSLGIGNSNMRKIIEHFSDLRDLWIANNDQIRKMINLREPILENIIKNKNIENIESLFKKIEKENIEIVTIYDENYPKGLKYIDDKPKVIYRKGKEVDVDLAIAIVGSRKATSYGKWACAKFTKELVDMGVTIISGLASGIDAVAHKTALDNGGKTIGVLGNGIDVIYPKSNRSLYAEMEKENSIITEFPFGTQPLAFNFPQRNRIIAGISKGVIVIEAQEKSGSLITAHQALDQGKDIFALPGNINSIFSSGTNKLIKDGAKPLLTIDDIIEEVYELREKVNNIKKNKIDYSEYSETEIKIIKMLEERPVHSDIIAHNTGIDISTVNSILTILELKGTIREISSSIFTIY